MANVAEHRIEMPVAAAAGGKAAAALPEKWLNRFVRVVASMERLGNALGTLAFTWATVVLLGGYPTVLRPNGDFVFATVIIFLEALSGALPAVGFPTSFGPAGTYGNWLHKTHVDGT